MTKVVNLPVQNTKAILEKICLVEAVGTLCVIFDYSDGNSKIFEMEMKHGQGELVEAFRAIAEEIPGPVEVVEMI